VAIVTGSGSDLAPAMVAVGNYRCADTGSSRRGHLPGPRSRTPGRGDGVSVTWYASAGETYQAIVELAYFVRELPALERCAVKYAANRIDANRLHTTIAQDSDLSPHQFLVNQIGPAVAAYVGPAAIGVVVVVADVD